MEESVEFISHVFKALDDVIVRDLSHRKQFGRLSQNLAHSAPED